MMSKSEVVVLGAGRALEIYFGHPERLRQRRPAVVRFETFKFSYHCSEQVGC